MKGEASTSSNPTKPPPHTFHYNHMFDAMYKIQRDEGGVKTLFRGSLTRIFYHVPMTAISMAVLEQVKPRITNYYEERM